MTTKFLVTLIQPFIAPDGKEYKAVHGISRKSYPDVLTIGTLTVKKENILALIECEEVNQTRGLIWLS